jgi:hypothetical protein
VEQVERLNEKIISSMVAEKGKIVRRSEEVMVSKAREKMIVHAHGRCQQGIETIAM